MKKLIITILYSLLLLIYVLANLVAQSFSYSLEVVNRILLLGILIISISISSIKCWKERNLLQPIMLVNGFIFFIFILRPIFLLINPSNVIYNSSFVMERYNSIYGINDILQLPFSKALFIGVLGLMAIYFGYYVLAQSNNVRNENKIYVFDNISRINRNTENDRKWIILWGIIAVLGIIMFFSKFSFTLLINTAGRRFLEGISFSVYESFWIYLIPCIIIFMYIQKGHFYKINMYMVIMTYSILSMSIGRRYIVINILLVIIILEYYIDLKRKVNLKLIFLFIISFLAVIVYGSIRRNNIGANINASYFGFILDEFDMFDTLLLSLDYKARIGLDLYGGASYLSTLLRFIPESIWPNQPTYFDILHTQVLFKGTIHGGTPTSLLGSLFLNFSYLGVVFGGIIFGYILNKVYNFCAKINTLESLGYYALFCTFIYDIIRVGDIGREFWTLFIYIFAYYCVSFTIKRIKI